MPLALPGPSLRAAVGGLGDDALLVRHVRILLRVMHQSVRLSGQPRHRVRGPTGQSIPRGFPARILSVRIQRQMNSA